MGYLNNQMVEKIDSFNYRFDKMFKNLLYEPFYGSIANYSMVVKNIIEDLYDNILANNKTTTIKLAKKLYRLIKNNINYNDFKQLIEFAIMNYGKNYMIYYSNENSFKLFKITLEILANKKNIWRY